MLKAPVSRRGLSSAPRLRASSALLLASPQPKYRSESAHRHENRPVLTVPERLVLGVHQEKAFGHLSLKKRVCPFSWGVAPPAPVSASPPGSPLSWGEAYLSARLMAEAQDRIRTSWDRRGILKPRHGCLCRREAPVAAKTAPIFGARRTRGP